jgi:hypothetical protein
MIVVMLLDQIMVMVIFRVGQREIMIQWRRGRHGRRSIYEIFWWLIFCAEAHVALHGNTCRTATIITEEFAHLIESIYLLCGGTPW